MSEQDNVKVARAFLQAFNAADWDGVKASLAPNSVYDELGTQRHVEGSDAIVSLYQAWKTAMPDIQPCVTTATPRSHELSELPSRTA